MIATHDFRNIAAAAIALARELDVPALLVSLVFYSLIALAWIALCRFDAAHDYCDRTEND